MLDEIVRNMSDQCMIVGGSDITPGYDNMDPYYKADIHEDCPHVSLDFLLLRCANRLKRIGILIYRLYNVLLGLRR